MGGLLIVAAGEVRVDVDGCIGGLELELGGRVELAADGRVLRMGVDVAAGQRLFQPRRKQLK